MDTVTLTVIVLIIGLCIVVYSVLKSAATPSARPQPKTKEQKRAEIIDDYRRRMDDALRPYAGDKETLQAKKTQLLREFSAEFSRNIFFDADEVREIIGDLAHYPSEK